MTTITRHAIPGGWRIEWETPGGKHGGVSVPAGEPLWPPGLPHPSRPPFLHECEPEERARRERELEERLGGMEEL